MTTPEVVALTRAQAELLTAEINRELGNMANSHDRARDLIRKAIRLDAPAALGYSGLSEYVSARFAGALARLGVATRREVVGELDAGGMSSRAIAPVVGVSDRQVRRDLSGGTDVPPEPGGSAEPEPSNVVGLDGKRYTRPAPAAPRRRPLTEGFRDATLDLAKVVTRIETLTGDDRLPKNRDEVARYANDLIRARNALQRAIDQLST